MQRALEQFAFTLVLRQSTAPISQSLIQGTTKGHISLTISIREPRVSLTKT
jgi:hypothetical protein